jgi:hypothetical protein
VKLDCSPTSDLERRDNARGIIFGASAEILMRELGPGDCVKVGKDAEGRLNGGATGGRASRVALVGLANVEKVAPFGEELEQ